MPINLQLYLQIFPMTIYLHLFYQLYLQIIHKYPHQSNLKLQIIYTIIQQSKSNSILKTIYNYKKKTHEKKKKNMQYDTLMPVTIQIYLLNFKPCTYRHLHSQANPASSKKRNVIVSKSNQVKPCLCSSSQEKPVRNTKWSIVVLYSKLKQIETTSYAIIRRKELHRLVRIEKSGQHPRSSQVKIKNHIS